MRDRKYRAWDKVKEEFIYSDKVAGGMWRFFKLLEDRGIRHFEADDFAGLQDKNNVDIYEGDLIKLRLSSTVAGEVYFDNRGTQFRIRFRGDMQYDKTMMLDFAKYGEVIGNVYENPELLNQKL